MQSVPRILTSTKQLQNPQANQNDTIKLKSQVQAFIKDIKSQFSTMVNNYEQQIFQLKKQSQILKRSTNASVTTASPMKKTKRMLGNQKDIAQSLILPLRTNQFYRTYDSPFYRTEKKSSNMFPSWGSTFEIRNTSPKRKILPKASQNQFPQQLITDQFDSDRTVQRSKYQRQSEKKRQRQEEIVHILQSHKKNLNQMTSQMINLVGKTPKNQNQSIQHESQEDNQQSRLKSHNDHHNVSLSQICQSLDHSFVSQKARKSKLKQKKAAEQANKKKMQLQNINEKIRKQRALKNLLQRLRQNANSANPPQIVKGSKLIPTGPKTSIVFKQEIMPVRKNSKVMINPVPVNSEVTKMRRSSPIFVEKRPTSILKQSSNILTKSICGISAISFEE